MISRLHGSLATAALLFLCLPAGARGASPSIEGYTGILRTPTAWVEDPGKMQFLVGSMGDGGNWEGSIRYALTVGVLPYLELAALLTDWTDSPGRTGSSHSANIKLQLPLDLLIPRFPVGIAIGAQDIGGARPDFRTRYVVASGRLWRVEGSIGWGSGPDRLQGLFGGVSCRLLDGVELVADWDAADVHVGLKAALSLEAIIGSPFKVGALVASAVTRSPASFAWGVNLEIPLWWNASPGGQWSVPQYGAPAGAQKPSVSGADGAKAASQPLLPLPGSLPALGALLRLEDALLAEGFEEVRVGHTGDGVVVEYENDRYNQDQADGLYVALREVERSEVASAPLLVILKRHGIRLAAMEFASGRPPGAPLIPPMTGFGLTPPAPQATWASPSPRNPVTLHSQVVLGPGLRTWVGTETGTFDFQLSLRPELYVNFWPGALGYVRADVPVLWSAGLQETGGLWYARTSPVVQYALLQQAAGFGSGFMAQVATGLFSSSWFAVLGEAIWAPGDGDLALGVQGGWFADSNSRWTTAVTGSVRYRFTPIDIVASLRAGRFVDGDIGAAVRVGKWFGDTQVGFFFTQSDHAIAGGFISFPLTFRRDMSPGFVQVRGPRRWSYELGTRVGSAMNTIGGSIGMPPLAPVSLESEYLDESRVSREGLGRSYE